PSLSGGNIYKINLGIIFRLDLLFKQFKTSNFSPINLNT
ncbi:unnamed protein product, partial [marine sediment metagenome]